MTVDANTLIEKAEMGVLLAVGEHSYRTLYTLIDGPIDCAQLAPNCTQLHSVALNCTQLHSVGTQLHSIAPTGTQLALNHSQSHSIALSADL